MYRILIVAREEPLRALVRLSLAGVRAEVRCVATLDELPEAGQGGFDLALFVGVGSFLSGGDPVRRLRPAGERRPVIHVLAWQQTEQLVLGLLEYGVDQYMTFPVNLNRLRIKVSEALRGVRR